MSTIPGSERTPMSRPLGPMELGVFRMDRAAPLNFTVVSEIQGTLEEATLRGALAATRARHPFLRARIYDHGAKGASFVFDVDTPFPLRVVRTGAIGAEVEELEREINTPLPWHTGPLARATLLLVENENPRLLVTFHHCIGDGMSGVYLTRDILRAAQKVVASGDTRLPVLADIRPMDDRLPAAARGFRFAWRMFRMVTRELWVRLRHGRPLKVRRDANHPCYERRARVLSRVLERGFAQKLADRCRNEKTTVHGALAAAMILGIMGDARLSKMHASIQFGSPVNMRERLEPEVGDDLGFYVSMVGYRTGVSRRTDLWSLARDIKGQLSHAVDQGEDAVTLRVLRMLFKSAGGHTRPPHDFANRWEKKAPTTSGLTNLGRLPIETRYDPLLLRRMHFAANPSGLGDFIATATGLDGSIFWNFVWADPVFSAKHAENLVENIMGGLRASVEGA